MIEVIQAKTKDLGDGFVVRRSIPIPRRRSIGYFVFWDHMGPADLDANHPMVVRAHPHIGLATITYLFDGEIMHRDSLGNEQPIRPGEVNWMTAGSGIVHSERVEPQETMRLEGIQLWVALPKEHEEVDPSFVHVKSDQLPEFSYGGQNLRLIAGQFLEYQSPVPVLSDLFYLTTKMSAGQRMEIPIDLGREAAVYVVHGKIKVEGESSDPESKSAEKTLSRECGEYSLVVFDEEAMVFETLEDCDLMIFGGAKMPEPRFMWWNFVSSSRERIEQAKTDWKEQRFAPVINETDFTPLPSS